MHVKLFLFRSQNWEERSKKREIHLLDAAEDQLTNHVRGQPHRDVDHTEKWGKPEGSGSVQLHDPGQLPKASQHLPASSRLKVRVAKNESSLSTKLHIRIINLKKNIQKYLTSAWKFNKFPKKKNHGERLQVFPWKKRLRSVLYPSKLIWIKTNWQVLDN